MVKGPKSHSRSTRDWMWVLGIWAVLTVLGEWAVAAIDFMPLQASEEAVEIDHTITILNRYSVPVMSFVLAMLGVSLVRHRQSRHSPGVDAGNDDGPPIHGSRPVTWSWFVITALLAVLLFVNPGYTGVRALANRPDPELTFGVEGVQWHWNITYPDGTTTEEPEELVLPVDTPIRFELSSVDVLHSFWVPGFRMKQDVVPGRTTVVDVTPTIMGTFEDDPSLRLQCAELCGTGHARMRLPVRVVEREVFDTYVAELSSGGEDMGEPTEPMEDMDMDEPTEPMEDMDMDMDEEMDMSDG